MAADYLPGLDTQGRQQRASYSAYSPEIQRGVAEVVDAGHHLVLDQPAQTVTLVLDFLRRQQLL